ncbi:CPBP family intramembrane metalloprotease [Microcoleus sp. FACHB-1515]|uniref:CPBP family intramembrane glutamic endopeptidase n=1 Tax=Cyanophyceae TaxID=3028117 RepID=UPI0016843F20|nr:type II CAAX endopeptidase family protein [Microcoleus sp. FACHB-1515]MBD2090543.1 CPBP family intramembrane metalloprotease [Microcoleus sp. FACHB-1515]
MQSAIAIVRFFVIWIGLWLPIAILIAISLKWRPPQPLTLEQKLPLLASLYAIAPIVLWGFAGWENPPFAIYGLPWHSSVLIALGVGLAAGVGGILLLVAIEILFGWVKVTIAPAAVTPTALLTPLILGLWVGVTEELIFRGLLLNVLQGEFSGWTAAAIASVVFALLHLVWEGSANLPQLPGLWLMGMVLSLARWTDGGQIGLAWGLHAGWIWGIASLDATGAIAHPQGKLAWLTGLDGKPLAGGMGLLFLLGTGFVLWRL